MKVRYIGETKSHTLNNGQIYNVLSVEKGWYRIIDKSGEDYLYPPEKFEIIENNTQQLKSVENTYEKNNKK